MICKEFADHFASVGKNYANKIAKPIKTEKSFLNKIKDNPSSIFFYPTTERELELLIDELPNKTSTGHDNISNKLLKALKQGLTNPLCIIFNKSLEEGYFPSEMKKADVIPLYKSSRVDLVTNYRPISLLLTISKLLEKVVYKRTYNFLDQSNLLYNSQYGFRAKHSCKHAIEELSSKILKNKENGIYTIAIYLDLSKAFDTISHNMLLKKLNKYGIRGQAHNWFKHYLCNRTMRSKCTVGDPPETNYSTYRPLEYGTPQGSCLGPLLFMIFVNDLHHHLEHCECILFADDTTIYLGHRNLKYLEWCIESDLANIAEWFKANKLTLNLNKTVGMIFNPKKAPTNPQIMIDDKKIPFVHHTKFLGVWIDDKLSWHTHTNNLTLKLKRNLNMLKMSKNLLPVDCKQMLYYAQIYSHLKYGIVIWGPMVSNGIIRKLQNIQNDCLKQIFGKHDYLQQASAKGILNVQNLIKLELLKMGYKVHKKELPLPVINCFLSDFEGRSLIKTHQYGTRNKAIPNNPKPRTRQYQCSFLCKSITEYSTLLVATSSCKNLKHFTSYCKHHLINTHDKSQPSL